ncbi:dipeptidase PepV [Paenibacillus sp. LMG 31458]|uniref:Dipeptidase PepV n=1 Tax=Paenibacillus phytorum TaxID=2654977 RepID=A0ABX1Y2D3_9BACL|nr:dipeptidase PepV [Paenibacillus phytorum]
MRRGRPVTIGSAIRSYQPEIVEHIQALIRIRSVASESMPGRPFGEEIAQALHYMLDLGASMGFRTVNVDGYAGHVEYGDGEELVAVLVHLDTVPEGIGWTYDPLSAEIHNGRIYGRGASDDKGPAVVALYALKAIKDLGVNPKKRIRIIFGTNEENGMTDMDHYFAREPVPDYAFTPDAAYPIIHAEKGYYVFRLKRLHTVAERDRRILEMAGGVAPNVVPEHCRTIIETADAKPEELERIVLLAEENPHIDAILTKERRVEITAVGKSGHGSYPPSGINAISHMAAFLHTIGGIVPEDEFWRFIRTAIGFEAFGESLGLACNDPVHGRLTVNLAQIRLDEEMAEAILNVRYPVTADGKTVLAKLRQKAAGYGVEVEVAAYMAPLFVPPDHALIRKLSRAYEAIMGEKAELLSIGGGTYARKLQNRGVAFGAGFRGTDTKAHQPDEFVIIEDMMLHGEICTQAIYELIRTEEEE